MPDEADPPYERGTSRHKIPITPKTLPALIRLGLALRKADKTQDLAADSPGLVMFDEHSLALLKHAQFLASADREDDDAVDELVAMAKRHGKALRVAALGARQWGQHRESSFGDLAHRLLQAAINETPVEPISIEEHARLEKLDAFSVLPSAEKWRELVALEPRLGNLEADARAGVFGRGRLLTDLPQDEQRQAAIEELTADRVLKARLEPLVGRKIETADVVLGSRTAFEAARSYLESLYEAEAGVSDSR